MSWFKGCHVAGFDFFLVLVQVTKMSRTEGLLWLCALLKGRSAVTSSHTIFSSPQPCEIMSLN